MKNTKSTLMVKVPALMTIFICLVCSLSAQEKPDFSKLVVLMTKESNPDKNVLALHSIIRLLKLDTINNMEQIDVLNGEVALSYLRTFDFTKFDHYINRIKNKFNQTSYLNMAAEKLLQNDVHLDYACSIAERTVKLYEDYKDEPSAKPGNFPANDWNRFMSMAAYPYYETYAVTLQASGKLEQALFYEEKALKNLQPEEISLFSSELHTELLSKFGQNERAYNMLLKRAKAGTLTTKMKSLLKELIVKKLGNTYKAVNVLDSIEKDSRINSEKELLKDMKANITAPNFTLLDLKGQKVTLADFKGRIVVLDFWATWCAPCVASMPAMKKASFAHPEVVFLFIATMEQGDDSVERVRLFVKKNKFPLNVLMDSPLHNTQKFQVASDYNITGIPTKVLIDKNGKLRFVTAGFKSELELKNELDAMIAIIETQK